MIVNVWLAVREDASELTKIALEWDEEKAQEPYVGPVTAREQDIYRKVVDPTLSTDLFKSVVYGGFRVFGFRMLTGTWTCWSLVFDVQSIKTASDEIEWLTQTKDVDRTYLLGAWDFETGEVVPGITIDPDILDFVPGVITVDEKGNVIEEPATDLSTANKLYGQADRQM